MKTLHLRKHAGTITLIVLNVVLYSAMVIATPEHSLGQQSNKTLIEWGAGYGPLTLGGQPWRLLSCTFLHAHLIHILINLFGLAVVGREIEELLGTKRFLFIYLISGVFGSVFSLEFLPIAVTVGASGSLMGVLGSAFSLIGATDFKQLVVTLKRRLLVLLAFIILAVAPTFFMPGIDNAAHVGGLIAGLLAGFAISASSRQKLKPLAMSGLAALTIAPIIAYFAIAYQYHGDRRFISQNYIIDASALMTDKKYKEALPLLNKAVESLPEEPPARYKEARLAALSMRVRALVELKQFEAALRDIDTSEPICDDITQLKRTKALVKFKQKDYAGALRLYEEALTSKPDDYELLNAVAWTQAPLGQLDDALKNANRSLEKQHDAIDVLDTRGTIYLLMKNYEKALEDLDHAIKIKPKSSAAYFHRAGVYLEQGEMEKCDADLKAARELKYEPDVWEPDTFGDLIERWKLVAPEPPSADTKQHSN